MKIVEKKEMVEQITVTYVAEDGKECSSESECKKHEAKIIHKRLIKAAEKFRIKGMDDTLPLSNDGTMNENNSFRWYKLESEADFETVNKAYANSLKKPENYPEIMCVETVGYEPYEDDAYSYDMSTCRTVTEEFWKKLGYKVTFEPCNKEG